MLFLFFILIFFALLPFTTNIQTEKQQKRTDGSAKRQISNNLQAHSGWSRECEA